MSGMFDPAPARAAASLGANVAERAQLPPSLAISTVIFALTPDHAQGSEAQGRPTLWIPLVRRVREPFRGQWALPGGPLAAVESLEDAARRNLKETTGLAPEYLEQLYAFGGLNRSSRPERGSQRVVSIVYWALVRPTEAELLGTGEELLHPENVAWHRADTAGHREGSLAFDHREIVDYALWRLRSKLEYAQIAYHFLGETFTLAQLREVHEAVLGRPLDPANFRRQLKGMAEIEPTDQFLEGGRHRPPRLYRYTGARGGLDPSTGPPSPADPWPQSPSSDSPPPGSTASLRSTS
ncbi:NUDIX domain-containing protein [Sinomonas notoginsengisoli]|uniref:NUDIX hydrolase n=1 Tax=Sinomonas notoginsengisoli TaxID=1457311 RepID=UPI001F262C97|nr:NUDIX domain-containing protein [Sinomonas notoginsengisoli]